MFRILLDPKGEGEGGPSSAPDLAKAVQGLIDRHGTQDAALRTLLAENYSLRDANRDLKAKVPGEGTVVLQGDDAKDWNSYRELGKVSDLRKAVSERDQFQNEAEAFRRAESYAEAATLSGMNPKAFRRLAEQEKLRLETKEIRGADGKLTPTVHVKGTDDKGAETLTPIDEYAEKAWPEMLPALRDGQKVDPARPNGTPLRRDPPASPPPPGDGRPTTRDHLQATVGYKPM
jgi:hypothetical protein